MDTCKGCGLLNQGGRLYHGPAGLCARCRRRVRDAARGVEALVTLAADPEVVRLLEAVAASASALMDGRAARLVALAGGLEGKREELIDEDGWDLCAEVAA